MFFLFPGSFGSFFSIIIIYLVVRLIFRSVFGGKNTYRNYYTYQNQQRYQNQYTNQNRSNQNQYQNVYQPRKNYYSVLGLKEDATDDAVKKAYRKLIMEYHPDTVANKGLNDEFKEFATKRFREIQEAYEEICKQRGIK